MYMFYYIKKYFYYCNNKFNGGENFERWNDTSIAHMFIRLISKTNHPYSDMHLSREQFDADYELLEKYIEWRRKNQIVQKPNSSYNFNYSSMSFLLENIDYDTQNQEELSRLWNNMFNDDNNVKVVNTN